jgi:SDR family mycofactocin-dependent oxidoreductase
VDRLTGKVVFISGVARGQGRAQAVRLAREGADIIGIDICADIPANLYPLASKEDLNETRRLVEELDRRAVLSVADVREPGQLQEAVTRGVAELGHLDAVVAQAGICPLGSADPQAFLDAVTVDFNGVVNAVDATLPHLPDGGSIVITGSVAAMVVGATDNVERGYGGFGYSFAKRAVASFVHDLAFVLAGRMIRVNAIHPTNVNTELLHSEGAYKAFRQDLEHPTREEALEGFPSLNAMPVPYVEPEEIASLVAFLVSDESRFITGVQHRVDAGAYVKKRPQQPTF